MNERHFAGCERAEITIKPMPGHTRAYSFPPTALLGKKIRGKSAPQYLEKGTLLSKKYRLEKMIGGGGFGQIYRATNVDHDTVVAIKVQSQSEDAARMVLEQMVLTQLIGTRHSPRLYCSGATNGYNYIVMQMLGRNLTELRKMQKDRKFTVHTVRRDIKPSNMCVGLGEHRRIIYVVDFGMARQYRRPNGQWRRERKYVAFRGTMRYVSLAVHERREQGPVDDLWSLYYTLIELAESALPWRTVTEHDEIFQMKRKLAFNDLCISMPHHFEMFPILLSDIQYFNVPDYNKLSATLKKCCKSVDEDADFEWNGESSTQSY